MTVQDAIGAESRAIPGSESGVQVEDIRLLILMVNKTAMRDLDRRLEASGTGISGLQYGVMRLLSHESGTISDLSGRMLLAPATLVPVVDALERKGFVQRGSDPKDRRRIPLMLTASGLEVMMRLPFTGEVDSLAQGLASLGREKSRHLEALLHELVNHLTGDDTLIDRALAMTFSDPPKPIS
jgi:DNA-binding MarR family transcriptional regulator